MTRHQCELSGRLAAFIPKKIAGNIICIAILCSTMRRRQPWRDFLRRFLTWSILTWRIRRSCREHYETIGENTCNQVRRNDLVALGPPSDVVQLGITFSRE